MSFSVALRIAVFLSMIASISRAEPPTPPAPSAPSADDGMPELRANVFHLDRIEKHQSRQYGTITTWVFKFRHHEAKALSFYGYSNEDGEFFSGYGDFWRFNPGDPTNRRYYGYQLHGPKGWRKTNPWQFTIILGLMAQPVTPREFTIEPGVDTELRFNLGHGSFANNPSDKREVRIGIFAPEGDFWSDPIKLPGIE